MQGLRSWARTGQGQGNRLLLDAGRGLPPQRRGRLRELLAYAQSLERLHRSFRLLLGELLGRLDTHAGDASASEPLSEGSARYCIAVHARFQYVCSSGINTGAGQAACLLLRPPRELKLAGANDYAI